MPRFPSRKKIVNSTIKSEKSEKTEKPMLKSTDKQGSIASFITGKLSRSKKDLKKLEKKKSSTKIEFFEKTGGTTKKKGRERSKSSSKAKKHSSIEKKGDIPALETRVSFLQQEIANLNNENIAQIENKIESSAAPSLIKGKSGNSILPAVPVAANEEVRAIVQENNKLLKEISSSLVVVDDKNDKMEEYKSRELDNIRKQEEFLLEKEILHLKDLQSKFPIVFDIPLPLPSFTDPLPSSEDIFEFVRFLFPSPFPSLLLSLPFSFPFPSLLPSLLFSLLLSLFLSLLLSLLFLSSCHCVPSFPFPFVFLSPLLPYFVKERSTR